jgi:hypothetical protein
MFKPGDKVVCIDDSGQIINVLKKGEIYTIRKNLYDVGVYLKEIKMDKISPLCFNSIERPHKIERFKLLEESFGELVASHFEELMKEEEIVLQ